MGFDNIVMLIEGFPVSFKVICTEVQGGEIRDSSLNVIYSTSSELCGMDFEQLRYKSNLGSIFLSSV